MAAAITGLAALLHTSAIAFGALKWAGVGYLLYLAWTTLRERGTLIVEQSDSPPSTRGTVTTAVLVNLLNPKLTIFFFAFLPQFVGGGESQKALQMVALSLVFMGITFIVFAIYGALAAAVRDRVLSRPRVLAWIRRTFAASFIALSAKLAFSRQ
jgi:threonine/homoserine/homoserine lactone efflux protein